MSGCVVFYGELDQNFHGRRAILSLHHRKIHHTSLVIFVDDSLIDWRAQNAVHLTKELESLAQLRRARADRLYDWATELLLVGSGG